MGNGLFRARKRTALAKHKSFQQSKSAVWWDGRERNWMLEAWDLLDPLSEGKWWAWAALGELTRDFERVSKQLAMLVFSEIGVEKRIKLLPEDSDGYFRAHNLELKLCSPEEIESWRSASEEMLSIQALWRSRPAKFVPPLLHIVGNLPLDHNVETKVKYANTDFHGARCIARATRPKATKTIVGNGAKGVPLSVSLELSRIARNLNLKQRPLSSADTSCEQSIFLPSEMSIMGTASGVRFVSKLKSIFPLELERKKRTKVKKNIEESESETSEVELPSVEKPHSGSDDEVEFNARMTTDHHIQAWLSDMDYKKLTKRQIRELLAKKEAGEPVPDLPAEVHDRLVSKSEKRVRRIAEEVDQQYSSKKMICGERRLRPELVIAQQWPLNADAHEPWNALGVTTKSEDAKEVCKATERLVRSVIPQLAMELEGRERGGEAGWTRAKLRDELHARGVPMRRLADFAAALWGDGLRRAVVTDMVVRVCKGMLRGRMWTATRESRGHAVQPCLDAAAEFLLLVFGAGPDSEQFWDQLPERLAGKFAGYENLTREQKSMMREWERCAAAVTDADTRREYAELKMAVRRLGKDDDPTTSKRFEAVGAHLRHNIDREQELRVEIDKRFRHIRDQVDIQDVLAGLLHACGLTTVHATVADLLSDCRSGILAPTDMAGAVPRTKTMQVAEAAEALQTLFRTKEERDGRRERDLDRAVSMLGAMVAANRHDWLLRSFYADAIVLRLDVSGREDRLVDLRLAFDSYLTCASQSPAAVQHLLEAGGVLYEMLSLKHDPEAEGKFLELCRQHHIVDADPDGYHRHLSGWAHRVLEAFRTAHGKRAVRLAALAGTLVMKSLKLESKGEEGISTALKDRGLEWADGLEVMDLVAVLELGRQVAHVGDVTAASRRRSWLPRHTRKVRTDDIGRALDVTKAPYVSEDALVRLLTLGQSLERFVAEGCDGVGAGAMESLVEQHAHSLTELRMTRCRLVDQDAIVNVAARCKFLMSLKLSEAPNLVTPDLMDQVCPYLSALTSLDLTRSVKLGNEGLRAIGMHCTELEALTLSGIPKVDDVGFIHIARKCQKLVNLDIRGCTGITGRSVVEMAMRTHCLWANRVRSWTRPGVGMVPVRGADEAVREIVYEDDDDDQGDDEAGDGAVEDFWEPEELDRRLFIGRVETGELSANLYGHKLDDETIDRMFAELDGVEGVEVLTHLVRVERATDWLLNGTDYQLPLVDEGLRFRNVEVLFEVFAQKNVKATHASAPTSERDVEEHRMDPEEFFELMRHLHIVPGYLSSLDVIHVYAVIMARANAAAKEEQEQQDLAHGRLSVWRDKTELGFGEFRQCFEAIAKRLAVSPADLSRLSRAWIDTPPLSREEIVFRIPFAGPVASMHIEQVKRQSRHDVLLFLYLGAVKVARDTLEVLDQPAISFKALHVKVITSWGPELVSQKHRDYSSEVHTVQLKETAVKQEVWLFAFDEDLTVSLPRMSDLAEFERSTITIQLVLDYFNPHKARLAGNIAGGFQHVSIASVTVGIPSYVDSDPRLQWLAFSQFQGMRDRREDEEGDDGREKTEEDLQVEEFQRLKMPPQMRVSYRVFANKSLETFRDKKRHHAKLRSRQRRDRWAEGAKDALQPGYLKKKVESRAEQAVQVAVDRLVEALVAELDVFAAARRFELLDLSHTAIHGACLQELLGSFDGLRGVALQNCNFVAGRHVDRLAKCTTSLTLLDVKGCTKLPAPAVNDLTRNNPLLSYVDVSMVNAVFDSTVVNVARCVNLRTLKISGCLHIPRTGFQVLLQCSALTELKMGGCAQLTEDALLSSVGRMTTLQALDVSHMDCVTDCSLELVLRSNRRLTSLNVSFNNDLSDQALGSLSRYGRGLRKLKMCGNSNFSDGATELVLVNCEALQKLSLAQDIGLTDKTLETLEKQGGDIQELDLCGCVGTTVAGRNQLVETLQYTQVYCDTVDGHKTAKGTAGGNDSVRDGVEHGSDSETMSQSEQERFVEFEDHGV